MAHDLGALEGLGLWAEEAEEATTKIRWTQTCVLGAPGHHVLTEGVQ